MRPRLLALVLPAAAAAALCAAGCQPAESPEPAQTAPGPDPNARLRLLEEPQGNWHTVEKGETFYALSRRYGAPVAAIAAANPQIDPRKLYVGAKVLIPGAPPASPGTTAPTAPPASPAQPTGTKPPAVKTPDRGRLCHPTNGRTSEVKSPAPGMSFSAPAGATVVSAAAGTVVLAAPDLGGLGPTVIVDHGNGLCTLYGRLSDYAVSPGQKLSRGEALGRSGAGGLVFRVYEGAEAKPPKKYLSK
jgi:murein DD-endopeptidase MepM/ murein hydrolase activator NlpD